MQLRAAPGGVAAARRVRVCAAPALAARADWAASLRPYTIRRGDTLESIAAKRGLEVKELHRYNKNLGAKGAFGERCLLQCPGRRVRLEFAPC